jgi:SOS-response transcriptional repressor LexA
MSELGAWVKQVRTSMALSQEKFGELFACTKGNVSAWENDRHAPSADQVMQMARLSGLALPGAADPKESQVSLSVASVLPADLIAADALLDIPLLTESVPLISWVQAGCWADVSDPFAPGVAEEWLPCPVRHGPNTYAVRVRGDSMYNPDGRPSYSDGDIIFVDPGKDAKHGDRVIVRLDDQAEATFKQLLIEDGRKLLKALNPDWKPRYIEINGNATMAGVVIGKWVPE